MTLSKVNKKLRGKLLWEKAIKEQNAVKFLQEVSAKLDQKQRIAAKGFYADKMSIKPEVETDDFSPLRECFSHLADDEKQILQEYFADIPHLELFEQRKKMQIKYDISLSSLRVKIFRLRERLENCLKEKSAK